VLSEDGYEEGNPIPSTMQSMPTKENGKVKLGIKEE